MSSTPDLLSLVPVVPVVVVDSVSQAVPIARALVAGGLPVIELTLRTPVALDAIRAIADEVPEILVGAGTIVTPGQASEALDAGAEFLVSPGTTPDLLDAMAGTGLPFLPGTATVSEVLTVLEAGFTDMKFFPAEASGGAAFLKSDRLAGAGCPVLPDRRDHGRHRPDVPRPPERRLRRRLVAHSRGRPGCRRLGPGRVAGSLRGGPDGVVRDEMAPDTPSRGHFVSDYPGLASTDSTSVTADEVGVDDPDGLHQGVHGGRADEGEATPLELLGERLRLR